MTLTLTKAYLVRGWYGDMDTAFLVAAGSRDGQAEILDEGSQVEAITTEIYNEGRISETETIAAEIHSERAAICEHDGLLTREQAEAQGLLESEQYRAACEVRAILEMRVKPINNRKEYLDMVEEKRGKDAAEKLRSAVRAEWMRRRDGK